MRNLLTNLPYKLYGSKRFITKKGGPMSILIAFPDKALQKTLAEILTYEDREIVECESHTQILDHIRIDGGDPNIDLVIMDHTESFNAFEILKLINDDAELSFYEVEFIIISGDITIPKAVSLVKLGAFDTIEKPPDLHRLLQQIQLVLSL